MKISSLFLGSLALALTAVTASATVYSGNGAGAFGGPIGMGSLTLSSTGGVLYGTINIGGNIAFNDELVIYVDDKTGGFNSTSTLTDTGTPAGSDTLRGATSGLSNAATPVRAALNFPTGFGADYAIALSPSRANFGSLYTLNGNGATAASFTYGTDGTNGNANLSPTGTNNGNMTGMYTFSIPLSVIGSPTSFTFETTYLNGNDAYRSNEAFGNMIVDSSNAGNTTVTTGAGAGSASSNLGQDTGTLVGINTFTVPEPSTWAMMVGGAGLLIGFQQRRRSRA